MKKNFRTDADLYFFYFFAKFLEKVAENKGVKDKKI